MTGPSRHHLFDAPYLNVRPKAVGDGITDDTAAIQACIDACSDTTPIDTRAAAVGFISELEGGKVFLPRGTYKISSQLTLHDRVSLIGAGYSNTQIVASDDFADAQMINAVDGTSALFDSRIEGLRFNANNIAGITNVIRLQAWQESCELIYCNIGNYQGTGVLVEDVSSGAALMGIYGCTIGGLSGSTTGIHVESTVPNGFIMSVSLTTLISASGTMTNGILSENGRLAVRDCHVERVTNGVHLQGGNARIDNLTGAASVTDLIEIASGFGGIIRGTNLEPNGGTNAVDDNVSSQNYGGVTLSTFNFPWRRTFTADDATPSVASMADVYVTANATGTTITDFDFGRQGQRFTLDINDANTTIDINGNANISRKDGTDTDLTPASGDRIEFELDNGVWYAEQFSPS